MYRFNGAYDEHYTPLGPLCNRLGACIICGTKTPGRVVCEQHEGLSAIHAAIVVNKQNDWPLPPDATSDAVRTSLPDYLERQTAPRYHAPYSWQRELEVMELCGWLSGVVFPPVERRNTSQDNPGSAAA